MYNQTKYGNKRKTRHKNRIQKIALYKNYDKINPAFNKIKNNEI